MFVEFSIRPAEPLTLELAPAAASEPLDQLSCDKRHALSACIEGAWDEVIPVIRGCHQALAAGQPRVVTTIVIVEDQSRDQTPAWPRFLQDAISAAPQLVEDPARPLRRIPVSV